MYSEFTKQVLAAKSSFDFVAAHFACEKDKFSPDNPNGYVNLGSAQNFLSKQDISQRLESLQWDSADTAYRQFSGTDSCRNAIANYLGELSGRNIDPNHVVVGNGLISVLEALSIAILNPEEIVLVPTPVFPGLVTALTSRTEARFAAIEANPENGFQFTPATLRAELERRSSPGQSDANVAAVLLCSPGNPIGQVYSADQIRDFVNIAEEFNIALIVDEIYASSCFDGIDFVSALTQESENVFVIGGLSKDFGLAGYTTAWVHTTNQKILPALNKQAHFFRLSAPIQRAIESFLDPNWRHEFSRQNRTRLTQCYQLALKTLVDIGVSVTPAEAGLVLWLDLREFLKSADDAGQLELYQYLLEQHRVHVSPASGFHVSQPGFYRICFSQQPDTLVEGLNRIQRGLQQFSNISSKQFAEV